jgi:protein-tyrosine phosphatase
MNFVTERLALSDAPTVRRLSTGQTEFDEIVTLGYLDEFGYERPEASTTGDRFVFPDGEHEYSEFEAAVDYVVDSLESGDTVLVHCQAGVSRSAAVATVALVTVSDESLRAAFSRVRAVRPSVNPHPELQRSMERYTGGSFTYTPAGYDEYPES